MRKDYEEKSAKDYKGQHLCDNCWNGNHYVWDDLKRKISNCQLVDEGGKCECHCVELMKTRFPRKKIDHTNQLLIDVGDDVIRVGETISAKHRDDA